MKNYRYISLVLLLLVSCTEEVFIPELQNVKTRLVINAHMDIDKNNKSGVSQQSVTLTNTSSFYNNDYPAVTGATIIVTNASGNSVGTFVETAEPGTYTATDFENPSIGEEYTLTITVNGEIYTAKDQYTGIVDLDPDRITQEKVVFPDEIIQLNINIDNEIGVDNFYLFEFDVPYYEVPEYGTGSDESISEVPDKNNYDFTYFDDQLKVGDNVGITIYGVSKQYNNFLSKILTLSRSGDRPFFTAPATVRGNVVNTTNSDNFALGFFSLNQFVNTVYTVKPFKE